MNISHLHAAASARGGGQMGENQGRKLLLVEDEGVVLLDVEAALVEEGFEIMSIRSGAEALLEIDKDAARFIGVVTDIRLGSGPDGWAVGHRIRELVPAMPVVYMSGDSASDWTANGVPDSVMLQKPFVNAQLITALATLLNRSIAP